VKAIRCGRGLGDSLYLQSVVRHLLATTEDRYRVRSDWPAIFSQLGPRVDVTPFSRAVDIVAHYSARKGLAGTTQFEDCCAGAGLAGQAVDLRLDWESQDLSLVHDLRRPGRPIVVVQLPRTPMGRTDGFGKELLPDCRVIQRAIDALRDRALIVQVGSGVPLFKLKGIDVDLANRTSVSQLLDAAAVADGFLGYCSFLVPLAESFAKPALLVWSSRGLRAGHPYVRQITPAKVLHRATSVHVVDDWDPARIDEVINAFLR
jgi:hypothetical protein